MERANNQLHSIKAGGGAVDQLTRFAHPARRNLEALDRGGARSHCMQPLDVRTRKVVGKTAPRHTSAEFIDFLTEVVGTAKWASEIHIVLDNLSAHKTKTVEEFLQANPKVRFHFTPTHSSWLNQVEIWFSKIERDVIARGVFTSVTDLARKLRKYIRAYGKSAKPFRWTYTDATRRIRSAVTI